MIIRIRVRPGSWYCYQHVQHFLARFQLVILTEAIRKIPEVKLPLTVASCGLTCTLGASLLVAPMIMLEGW